LSTARFAVSIPFVEKREIVPLGRWCGRQDRQQSNEKSRRRAAKTESCSHCRLKVFVMNTAI